MLGTWWGLVFVLFWYASFTEVASFIYFLPKENHWGCK